jgi:hypothetical protein
MKQNVGTLDGNLRVAIGAALTILMGLGATIWVVVPMAVMLSGFLHKCPLYSPLGWNTCGANK